MSGDLIRECVTVPGCCCCMPLQHIKSFDGLVQLCTKKYITSRQRGCIRTSLTPPKSVTGSV